MLYKIIKWIVRLTLNSYFRKMVITGNQHVPSKGPVIFVANHPSAFMDPMVVAFAIDLPLHFLAAAEFFGNGFKAWFYLNFLNMIPVYRPTTLPGESHKNEAIFVKCIELLSRGGAILVFPEGNSVTEKRIRKLKTGVARMVLGTRGKVQVDVIPVGLNYTNPHRFRSDLYVNIGKPISTQGSSTDKTEVARLTNLIEEGLKDTVHHIQNEELDSVVKKVELLLKQNFQSTNNIKEVEFTFQQKVIKAIQRISESNPNLVSNLDCKLNGYLNKIRELGISDGAIANLSILISLGELIRLILAFPIFVVGLAINSAPYYSTVFYFRRLNLFSNDEKPMPGSFANPAFKGSVALAIGMVLFIIFYLSLAGFSIWATENFWVGAGLLVLSYLTGLFAMQYIRWVYLFRQKWRLRKLISEKKEVFASLIIERQEIIKELTAVTN